MRLTVQHAGKALAVDINEETSPDDLRSLLSDLTGVLPRAQKLLHKGRVLPAYRAPRAGPLAPKTVTLASLGVTDGAKLMMLASGGTGGTAGSAALEASRAAAAAAAAAKRAAAPGGGSATAAGPQDFASRAAVWAKTGVIALRDAGLTSLPAEVTGVAAAATAADIGGNPGLTALPPSFGLLTRLSRLRLSGCTGLADLPDSFSRLSCLQNLLLDRCGFSAVPASVRGLPALKQLSLAHNENLASLSGGDDDTAAWPPALEVLDVSHCALRDLPASLAARCPRLSALDAAHNAIGPSLPPGLGRVAAVRLDSNRVESLPPGFLGGPGSAVAILSLRNNPITSDQLRACDGFAAYDARRLAAANKKVDARVIADGGGAAFQEGADAVEWCRWAG